jgi:hypothetical protein
MDHNQTSFGLRQMTAAGLKITMFCMSYTYPALRQVKHIKCYQNYCPKLRRNIRVRVITDNLLTKHMNVPGMEPTYASGEEAHVLIYYTVCPISARPQENSVIWQNMKICKEGKDVANHAFQI